MIADIVKASDAERKARIFISYSRKDMAFADRLEVALKARGFEVLIDREEIYAFEDWWKRIQALIGRADTIVYVLSPDAVASEISLNEVSYAALLNKRFAPIVCRQVDDSAVPKPLQRLNFIFFDDPTHFETSATALAEALQTDIDWIRKHTEYGEATRHWTAEGRARGLLLRSPVLEQAERWIASYPPNAPATEEIRAFIAESRRGASRQKLRAGAAVIVVTIAGLAAGWNQDWLRARAYALANVHALTATQESALKVKDSFKECTDCPEMLVVPAGSFMMGSSATEQGHDPNEEPQHNVTIAKPFAVSKFELTFDEWDACALHGGDCYLHVPDSGFGRSLRPAMNVSWDDALNYVLWLSRITGKAYRLLTEAEYEYATRAGTRTVYPWGDDIGNGNARCAGCSKPINWDSLKTAPVGSFAPNRFGLYDMVGNVMEWVEDCASRDNYEGAPTDGSAWKSSDCLGHNVRGGSWDLPPKYLRSAQRTQFNRSVRDSNVGFRVARTLTP